MIDLSGKVALVTGAARGQGEAEARLFAELGAKVVVGDRLRDEGRDVASSLGDRGLFVPLDVTSEADWSAAVEASVERFGRLDVLVNNAGIAPPGRPIHETSEALLRQVIDVNLVGVFLGMRAVVPALTEAGGGSIVNISSTAGLRGVPGSLPYSATKWAVRGMTKTAALEYGARGIRVNAVFPGVVDTAMVGWDGLDEGVRRAVVGDLPIARIGLAAEVARTVAFLASDASSYTTGGEFVVDGGSTAGKALFRGEALEAVSAPGDSDA